MKSITAEAITKIKQKEFLDSGGKGMGIIPLIDAIIALEDLEIKLLNQWEINNKNENISNNSR